MNNKNHLIFTFICVDLFLLGAAYFTGLWSFLVLDTSYISYSIASIYFLCNFLMLAIANDYYEKYLFRLLQWVPNSLVSLGLLGTVAGFFFVFHGLFVNFDFSNVDNVKTIISQLTDGFSIALISTITGITTSILLTLKMVWFRGQQ